MGLGDDTWKGIGMISGYLSWRLSRFAFDIGHLGYLSAASLE